MTGMKGGRVRSNKRERTSRQIGRSGTRQRGGDWGSSPAQRKGVRLKGGLLGRVANKVRWLAKARVSAGYGENAQRCTAGRTHPAGDEAHQ